MIILGIETSCDETAAALYNENGLLAHTLYSQVALHQTYGGVVPELASRDHLRKLLPLVEEAIEKAHLRPSDIEGIAYTAGPGLMGALLVGATFAKGLGLAWQIPTLGIHHLEGHLLAPMLESHAPEFPFLALLVSGGHTLLVAAESLGVYRILGDTLDDAVGEAFDKTGKLLGFPYPGGAELAKLAQQGDPTRFRFPRPMLDRPGLDMSFSGLKTHAWHVVETHKPLDEKTRADIARAFEDAVVAVLQEKCARALQETGFKRLVVAGGVGANTALRAGLQATLSAHGGELFLPRPSFCTDNAAMIAYAGFQRMRLGQYDPTLAIEVRPRWPLVGLYA